jgi:ABC-type lipoprotein export system ATPase subunit
VILSLKATSTTVIPGTTIPITLVLLSQQDVITSTQYYAKNIGMVYADTNLSYQLNSLPNVDLPIPTSGSQNVKEYLDTYLAN